MDCRRSLVALGMAWACCGCMGTQGQQQRPVAPETPPANMVQRDSDAPKRAPKSSTMVAYAMMKEGEAGKADIAPNIQRTYRDEARKAYQEALQVDPACLAAYCGLGRVYRDLGDLDRALDVYRKALEKHPREVGLWVDMGMCQARRKEFDFAIKTLQHAVELDPENRQALKALGFCLARAGRIDESIAYLSRSMGQAEAHLHVARMVLHLQANGAIPAVDAENVCQRHLEMALRFDPNLTSARELLTQLAAGARPRISFGVPFEGQ